MGANGATGRGRQDAARTRTAECRDMIGAAHCALSTRWQQRLAGLDEDDAEALLTTLLEVRTDSAAAAHTETSRGDVTRRWARPRSTCPSRPPPPRRGLCRGDAVDSHPPLTPRAAIATI